MVAAAQARIDAHENLAPAEYLGPPLQWIQIVERDAHAQG